MTGCAVDELVLAGASTGESVEEIVAVDDDSAGVAAEAVAPTEASRVSLLRHAGWNDAS